MNTRERYEYRGFVYRAMRHPAPNVQNVPRPTEAEKAAAALADIARDSRPATRRP